MKRQAAIVAGLVTLGAVALATYLFVDRDRAAGSLPVVDPGETHVGERASDERVTRLPRADSEGTTRHPERAPDHDPLSKNDPEISTETTDEPANDVRGTSIDPQVGQTSATRSVGAPNRSAAASSGDRPPGNVAGQPNRRREPAARKGLTDSDPGSSGVFVDIPAASSEPDRGNAATPPPLDGQDPDGPAASLPPADRQPRSDPEPSESPSPADPAIVRLLPSSNEVAVGERLSIAVDLSMGIDVGHVPFHLRFNPAVLRFDHGEEGGFLGSDGTPTVFIAAAGSAGDAVVVGLSRLGNVGGVDGSGRLCTLHFTAVGPGSAGLTFARARLRDAGNHTVPASFEAAGVEVR